MKKVNWNKIKKMYRRYKNCFEIVVNATPVSTMYTVNQFSDYGKACKVQTVFELKDAKKLIRDKVLQMIKDDRLNSRRLSYTIPGSKI